MKIKTYLTLLALALTSLFVLGSCDVEDSADVNQNKIYAVYEAFYNHNTDKTWVVARFRFGGPTGTLLELNDPAEVTFDGDKLGWNPLFFGHFKEYAGRISQGTFSYTNVDGDVFNNDLQPTDSIAFQDSFTTLRKGQANSIVWEGPLLGPDQRVGVFVGSWAWGQDALALQTTEGSNDIVLGIQQMENVTEGNAICYMDRTTEIPVQEGTGEGGVIRATFRAKNKNIEVVN
ncbi:MAG: hypothetical protein R3B47_08705 [Bacteroidia bacterium]